MRSTVKSCIRTGTPSALAWTSIGNATEITGTVVQSRVQVQAHVGGTMTTWTDVRSMAQPEGVVGPVLIYVGEASMKLEHRATPPARLRMTAGGTEHIERMVIAR